MCKLFILPTFLAIASALVSASLFASSFESKFIAAANEQTAQNIRYDGSYFSIPYPNGDIPPHLGVCTDVVIRAYRALGIDLQKLVHEDIAANFNVYPSNRIWGLTRPDTNIDHRRVPNLQTFFSRHGQTPPISKVPADYRPGDIVTWMLPGNLPHIGIVMDEVSPRGIPLIVHNIGRGPKKEDVLFAYDITGHYRYLPAQYRE